MDWVLENAVRPAVASMSLGSSFSRAVNYAVDRMYRAGIVVSVAAGNDNIDACRVSLVRHIKLRIQALINILIFTDRCSF